MNIINRKEFEIVRDLALKKGYITNPLDFNNSSRKGKRFMIKINGQWIHFGGEQSKNFIIYKLEGDLNHANKRREAFRDRFKNNKNINNNKKGIYYSWHLLW